MPRESEPLDPAPTVPGATYRLQLHQGFTLAQAAELASYLAALGITHCYCSPIFTATPGSTHGYDVCRHTEINPELGGEAALEAFSAALSREGLGLLLDFVPNHMSIDPHTNRWWRDVLENGPSSPFARFFDIDWDPIKPELKDRLLLPVLGESYGDALERGALRLSYADGALSLACGGLTLPINPRRSTLVYETGLDVLAAQLPDSPDMREFQSILTSLRNLPAYTERDAGRIDERQREKEIARQRLIRLVAASLPVRAHIERAVAAFNGTAGVPSTFDRLHALLEQQAYRLASWRTAADEINYRRFFDVNGLAALRVEDPVVFEQIHPRLLDLLRTGVAAGVRLDHIDGLFDPRAYLEALARQAGGGARRAAGDASAAGRPYLLVEKIVAIDEPLRDDWPIAGTTGYEFMNDVNGLLVDARHGRTMRRLYERVIGRQASFADVAYESKRLVVSTSLSSEFQVLAQAVNRLSERERGSRDFTLGSIRRALREVVACFPVYRTYIDGGHGTSADVAAVDAAIDDAMRRNPAMETTIFGFLRSVLLPAAGADPVRRQVAMRFQQYTAPVQAKGVEDTAFYRYYALASLNEVGGDPRLFGRSVDHFHAANVARQQRWPGGLLATSTHDTKRSEDARVRITALSEFADAWRVEVMRWRRLNAANRTRLPGGQAPDANDEYLFYQALVGAWPADALGASPPHAPADLVARLTAYMHKAIKEAKLHTSWIAPHTEYEAAMANFVARTLTGRTAPQFLSAFLPFVARVARAGMINALAQLVLKLAAPGVPDFYQGTEFWDLSLVDPDNRRPVDFAARRLALDAMAPWLHGEGEHPGAAERRRQVADWLTAWPDGRIKLYVTALGLRVRQRWPALFLRGSYQPLRANGIGTDHVVAFARHHQGRTLIAVVPRLGTALAGGALPIGGAWADTSLKLQGIDGVFRNLVTGETVTATSGHVAVGDVLTVCPVALLVDAAAY